MEVKHQDEGYRGDLGARHHRSTIATNTHYLAFRADNAVIIQDLDDQKNEIWRIALDASQEGPCLTIALSQIDHVRLAISHGHTVRIYDIESKTQTCQLAAAARTITAISWSLHDRDLFAIGCVDGKTCLWDVKTPLLTNGKSIQIVGAVTNIAWSIDKDGMLAISSSQQLCIWHVNSLPQLVANFIRQSDQLDFLQWHPRHTRTLLTASKAGLVAVWDFTQTTRRLPKLGHELFESRTLIGLTTELFPSFSLNSQRRLYTEVSDLIWSSPQTVLVLHHQGKRIARIDVRSSRFGAADWTTDLEEAASVLILREVPGRGPVIAAVSQKQSTILPLLVEPSTPNTLAVSTGNKSPNRHIKARISYSLAMNWAPIAQIRQQGCKLKKTKRQEVFKATSVSSKRRSMFQLDDFDDQQHDALTPMTILETTHMQVESPMPFLSPTIPAKTPLMRIVSSLDIHGSAPSKANPTSYFESFTTLPDQDTDSDSDDGYGILRAKASAAIPSGAANVPLPRTCGAVFSQSGVLAMFSTPKPRPIITKADAVLGGTVDLQEDMRENVGFTPAFGNLLAELDVPTDLAVSNRKARGVEVQQGSLVESLGLDRASFDSNQSWKPLATSGGAPLSSTANLTTVRLSVKTLDEQLLPVAVAERYRITTETQETGAMLCDYNAQVATRGDQREDALLWTLLGQILERPLSDSPISALMKENDHDLGSFSWLDHPFGSQWLIRRVFQHAESAANITMLAYMAAIVVGSSLSAADQSLGALVTRRPEEISTNSVPHQTIVTKAIEDDGSVLLTLERLDSQVLEDSPVRMNVPTLLSSRNTSQPTTPYLDSTSNTPPWSFSGLPQASLRLSMSGSASPETARSSFSAAVKSYAQSVSDKFAVYSTSPPVRKAGPSPNNELSSSLPSAGGSWTKTVSFASTSQSRGLGRSSLELEGGYDSDRTLEDNPAHKLVPRHKAEVKLTWKNEGAFDDDSAGAAPPPLIPSDMLKSCMIWCTAHASQMRSQRLDIEAVQFEKFAGAVAGTLQLGFDTSEKITTASFKPTEQISCCICSCIINGLEQICLFCRHASHMSCLSALTAAGSSWQPECPAGCGCECTFSNINLNRTPG